jgi:hypothetical protein
MWPLPLFPLIGCNLLPLRVARVFRDSSAAQGCSVVRFPFFRDFLRQGIAHEARTGVNVEEKVRLEGSRTMQMLPVMLLPLVAFQTTADVVELAVWRESHEPLVPFFFFVLAVLNGG